MSETTNEISLGDYLDDRLLALSVSDLVKMFDSASRSLGEHDHTEVDDVVAEVLDAVAGILYERTGSWGVDKQATLMSLLALELVDSADTYWGILQGLEEK